MKPNLLKLQSDRIRIGVLEELLKITIPMIKNMPNDNVCRQYWISRLSEYKLEYKERTGREYENR
jgi:hypothetical protein